MLEAIAHWGDEARRIDNRFRISVNTRSHGVHEYDLRELGYHGLSSGDTVTVRLNPFRAPDIMIIKEMPDGAELRFEVSPIVKGEDGRDITAPVIGQNRRPPDVGRKKSQKRTSRRWPTARTAWKRRKRKPTRPATAPLRELDPMADVKRPQYLRRQGTKLDVTAKTAARLSLNRAQAAQRLAQMCGEAWAANPTACNDIIKARYGESVPEEALAELAEAITARLCAPARQCAAVPASSREARHGPTKTEKPAGGA